MSRTIILTGASGYVGRLVAAAILAKEDDSLILPLRAGRDSIEVQRAILAEAALLDPSPLSAARAARLRFVSIEEIESEIAERADTRISEIIHCAGCVDYFNAARLHDGNTELTRRMLALARRLEVDRFSFMSTAFSCGDTASNPIPEALHPDSENDLTEYIRTKREAEWQVARSGLPYLILRPPILIGNSQDGRYCGKAYGLVQFWEGWSRLLCSKYRQDLHFVAPLTMTPVLHQDAFQKAVLMARAHLPDDSIIHLVSPTENLMPARDLYRLFAEKVRPEKVHFYPSYQDVPRSKLYSAARTFIDFCAVNIEISERNWRFERTNMEALEALGLDVPCATQQSIGACLQYFLRNSSRMQRYFDRYKSLLPSKVRFIDHSVVQRAET